MDSTYNNRERPVRSGLSFGVGFLLLVIGALFGIWGAKYYWQSRVSPQPHPTASAAVPADSSVKATPATIRTGAPGENNQWSPAEEVSQLQSQVDELFQNSFQNMKAIPAFATTQKPGYSLSMDVRDLKNQYQVRAFLPDTKTANVNVKLVGDELKVDVANHSSQKIVAKNGEHENIAAWGDYEEVVPLAGKLNDSQMKVQRKEHELIITIPKV